jgi:hypothetical protein
MILSASLVSTLFGQTASAAGDQAGAIALLKRATAAGAQAKGVAQEKRDPAVIATLAQYRKALAGAKDLKQALSDPRVLKVLLPAVGLASQVDSPGLAQRALLADPAQSNGLLSKLDSRWKAAAQQLGLYGKDISALRDPGLQQSLADQYVAYQYQKSLNAQQPGMSDALYFIANAGEQAGNVYNVLGDAVLRRVVTGALGLPQELAVQPVETQAQAVTARLPMIRLGDPKEVYKLAQRYLMAEAGNAPGTGGQDMVSLALSLRA